MDKDARIYVAGGASLIGSALLCRLEEAGHAQVAGGAGEPDLTDASEVEAFFAAARPEFVFLAAGKSGGIGRTSVPRRPDAGQSARRLPCDRQRPPPRRRQTPVSRQLVQLPAPGSAADGSRIAAHRPLEPTNEAYADGQDRRHQAVPGYRQQYGADFIAAIPANAFGPDDDFSPRSRHVIPALIRRMHEAKLLGKPDVVDLGHRHAAAGIHLRPRSGRRLPVRHGSLRTVPSRSISAPAIDLSIRESAEAVCRRRRLSRPTALRRRPSPTACRSRRSIRAA